MPEHLITFDLRADPEAAAKFAQWQQEQQEKKERDASILKGIAEKPDGEGGHELWRKHLRDALVLDELTAGRFMLHLASCTLVTRSGDTDTLSVRRLVHAKWPEQWEYLSEGAKGSEVVDCSTCKPRRELRAAFVAFRKQCIWLRGCFNTFTHLFHGDEPRRVLQRTAAHVFHDLNLVLLEYCLLQAAKITDPARSRVSNRESLTVPNLDEHLRAEGLMNAEIETASAGVMRYRGFIAEARNRVIAHIDKAVAIENKSLGAHPPEEVDAFLEHLQDYNDDVGRVVGEGPLCFRTQAGDGDAITLLHCLRVALHVKTNGGEDWWIFNKLVPE